MDNQLVLVRQHNHMTEARYELSETAINILLMVISKVRQDDDLDKEYVISIADLTNRMGVSKIIHTRFEDACEQLMKSIITVKNINKTDANSFLKVAFASSVLYEKGVAKIEISKKIRPYYGYLKERFTEFELNIALGLTGKYAKRMYQLISEYKNLVNQSFDKSIDELKIMLGIIDEQTGKDLYKNYADFEKNVLKPAEKEINSKANLRFTYKAVKIGRKVAKIEFSIDYNQALDKTKQISERSGGNFNAYEYLLNVLKLSPFQIEKIMKNHSIDDIREKSVKIIKQNDKKPITNIGGYAAKVFGLTNDKK
jgi:plasmid replication initiation protein